MQHPAELAVHSYLRKSISDEASMSQEVIDKVAEDIKDALHKQFNSEKRVFKKREKYPLIPRFLSNPLGMTEK